MSGQKHAVLIGCSRFEQDPQISPLRCPGNDVEGLARVLLSPELGGFARAEKLIDPVSHDALRKINEVFEQAESGDFVLLYYAGHGKPGGRGRLYLATRDTQSSLLGSTSIPLDMIMSYLDDCLGLDVAIILDCCYSGLAGRAFARGGIDDQLKSLSSTHGTYILCACGETEIALEKEGDEYGLLTKHIIRGIETGEADREGNGAITMSELFEYLGDAVIREGGQAPRQHSGGRAPLIEIARTGRAPREERRQRLKQYLHKLNCDQGLLPDYVYQDALSIIARKKHELEPAAARLDALLDRLYEERIRLADFLQQWKEAGGGADPRGVAAVPAPEAAAQAVPAPRPAGPVSAQPLATKYTECGVLRGHARKVWSLAFSPDGSVLASGSKDDSIRIWKLDGSGSHQVLLGHGDDVNCVRFSPDGTLLASGSDDRTIRLWQMPGGSPVRVLEGHPDWIRSVDFGPRNTLASGCDDKAVRIWDPGSGNEVARLTGHRYWVYSVRYSPDGRFLASASMDNTARIWDVASLQPLHVLSHQSDVRCAVFSPEGDVLATASDDKTIGLWFVESGVQFNSISCTLPRWANWARGVITSADRTLAFRPDGALLASGGADGFIWLIDSATSEMAQKLGSTDYDIYSLAFSPDGSLLAAADGKVIRLWRVAA